MKDIAIIISLKQTLSDLKLTLKNFKSGNFKKWGLTPILPTRKEGDESYEEAAMRFWNESSWKEDIKQVIPRIKKWWQEIGGRFAESVAKDLKVSEPGVYNIVLTPFGPGGSYNAKRSTIYVRITKFNNNNEWWQHVLAHEIVHLLSAYLDLKDHNSNEKRVNKLMKKKLIEFGLEKLI